MMKPSTPYIIGRPIIMPMPITIGPTPAALASPPAIVDIAAPKRIRNSPYSTPKISPKINIMSAYIFATEITPKRLIVISAITFLLVSAEASDTHFSVHLSLVSAEPSDTHFSVHLSLVSAEASDTHFSVHLSLVSAEASDTPLQRSPFSRQRRSV